MVNLQSMHDRNANELMDLWLPAGYGASDNQFLIGNSNKKSPLKLWLKLETSFSPAVVFTKSWVDTAHLKLLCYPSRVAHASCRQELLTSHLRDAVGCLLWGDEIYAVPPLAPSRSLQMPLSALPSCRIQSVPGQCLFSVYRCLFSGSVRQRKSFASLELENLNSHLPKCCEAGKCCYQDLILRMENANSSVCLRFSIY